MDQWEWALLETWRNRYVLDVSHQNVRIHSCESEFFFLLFAGGFFCCFFVISAAVFGSTDTVSQTWETSEVNYELRSLSEKSCAAEVSCCLSDISPVYGQSSTAGFFATLKDASRWAQVQVRRNQLSLRLNFPNDQPDFTARSDGTSCFATQSRSHFPQPEIWIFRIFIWATSFDLLQRYRENVKSTVAEQSGSLDRVQDTRSFGLLMEESTSCI